ncbi:hypothetical protein DMA11_20855 [Marinilabiliaceae bacterium JC017]|nr:hypothetical protein DMA11_20855 [Marinilabiliaceae bacterium JC017]
MKTTTSFLLVVTYFLISTISMQAQDHVVHSHCDLPVRLKVGDMYYALSYKGFRRFMTDLQQEDPVLYEKMLPSYSILEKKRRNGNSVLIPGVIVGTFLSVGSFTFLQKTVTETSIFDPGDSFYEPPKDVKEFNGGVFAVGMGINIVSALVAWALYPSEDDFYHFINEHNRHSSDKKMDWQIGFNGTPEQPLNLSLKIRF